MGAPDDEYAEEAESITLAVQALKISARQEINVVAVIAMIWGQVFELSGKDIEARMPAFQRVGHQIIGVLSQ